MSRSYVKVEQLAEEVFRRKEAGETNREIGEHFGLTKDQIKQLVTRQRRKQRMVANGILFVQKVALENEKRQKKSAATTNWLICVCGCFFAKLSFVSRTARQVAFHKN